MAEVLVPVERRRVSRDRYLVVDRVENLLDEWQRTLNDSNYIVALEELISRARVSLEAKRDAVRRGRD
jgi:hypothetical protein